MRRWLVLGAALWGVGASGQSLPPGAGFAWERVGNAPAVGHNDLTFDAGGTLWVADGETPKWLDLAAGWPGVWVRPVPPVPRPRGNGMLTLGGHSAGGPARADTVLVTYANIRRSTNGGATWSTGLYSGGNYTLYEIPAGHPFAGRVLVGNAAGYSLDRGATWTPSYDPLVLNFAVHAFVSLPPPERLPGAASGRDTAAPPGWPAGRIVAVGTGGVAILSDDGGESYVPTNLMAPGRNARSVTLVRRPDSHPLGPGPRLLACGFGEASASSVWSSDDGGATWARRTFLTELGDGPGWPGTSGIHAVSEPGESDPGGGGRAVVVLGRGHMYQTADGGETWVLVGRIPDMVASGSSAPTTRAGPSELGPDGRLYVGVAGLGSAQWLYRTAAPFVVSAGESPPPASEMDGVSLSVRPNPSSGSATITLTLAEAADVRVALYDLVGREVAVVLGGALGAGTHTASVPALAPGVYAVRATGDAGTTLSATRLTVIR